MNWLWLIEGMIVIILGLGIVIIASGAIMCVRTVLDEFTKQ